MTYIYIVIDTVQSIPDNNADRLQVGRNDSRLYQLEKTVKKKRKDKSELRDVESRFVART